MLSYIILGGKSTNPDVVKWGAIIVSFIGLIKFAIDKGMFNFIKEIKEINYKERRAYINKGKESRKLSDEQIKILQNHSLFNNYNMIISYELYELYNNSKKGITQLLFILQLHYTLIVHQQDVETLVKKILVTNRKSGNNYTKEQVVKIIVDSLLNSKKAVAEILKLKGILPEISNKFSIWYNEHYSWYISSVHVLLQEESTYFNEIQQFLTISKIFNNAIMSSAKNHIDSFNGEISSILNDGIISKIDFDKYTYQYKILKTKKNDTI